MNAILAAWNKFFFAEQSPVPLALFRIVYGIFVTATLLLLKEDWLEWYGAHAWTSLDTMRELEPGVRLNVFTLIPQDDRLIAALFWVFVGSALMLAVGFLTRANSVVVYLCLTSIQQRNVYILHGGDTLLRVAGFFLVFAPAGAALSVDRLIRVWRGRERPEVPACRLWAQRIMQIELSLLYIAAFCWKWQSDAWREGSALFYIYHLLEFERFPIPGWLLQPVILKLGTWFAMALELFLGIFLWAKDLRYIVLGAGLVFHLCLEYSLNIPLFQWDVLSVYILFLDPSDLSRARNWISVRTVRYLGGPVSVLYDPTSEHDRKLVHVLQVLDIFRRLSFLASAKTGINSAAEYQGHICGLRIVTASGARNGRNAVKALVSSVPLLWPLLPLVVFPLSGKRQAEDSR